MNLSKHCNLGEMVKSSRHPELNETNAQQAMAHIHNGELLTQTILEPIRELIGVAMITGSGFRGEALNDAVSGSPNSQHCTFSAWDGNFKGFADNRGRLMMLGYIMGMIDSGVISVGQLLIERDCIHISLPRGNGRDNFVGYYDVTTKDMLVIRGNR